MSTKKQKNLLVVQPLRFTKVAIEDNIQEVADTSKKIWEESYSEYNLLNEKLNLSADDSYLVIFKKYVSLITKADLVVFGAYWDCFTYTVLIKRVCDVFNINKEFVETTDDEYGIVMPNIDSWDYCKVNDLINALCKVPPTFGIKCRDFPGCYDDECDLGIGVEYSEEMIDIGSIRNACINKDRIDVFNDSMEVKKGGPSKRSERTTLTPLNELKNVKSFVVDIVEKCGATVSGVFYNKIIDKSSFDNVHNDVYYVSGFDCDDYDCPVKISINLDNKNFEDIGTLVVKKYALDGSMEPNGCLYIDGDIFTTWKLGVEIK